MTGPVTTADTGTAPTGGPVTRMLWLIAGCTSVAVGGIGIVVPVLPTTVFFVIAAWCFGHSSPRFEQWVLNLPTIGPLVRDYRAGLGMSKRAKIMANASMWLAIVISSIIIRDRPAIVAVVVALGLIGSAYILWRVPLRERVLAARGQ